MSHVYNWIRCCAIEDPGRRRRKSASASSRSETWSRRFPVRRARPTCTLSQRPSGETPRVIGLQERDGSESSSSRCTHKALFPPIKQETLIPRQVADKAVATCHGSLRSARWVEESPFAACAVAPAPEDVPARRHGRSKHNPAVGCPLRKMGAQEVVGELFLFSRAVQVDQPDVGECPCWGHFGPLPVWHRPARAPGRHTPRRRCRPSLPNPAAIHPDSPVGTIQLGGVTRIVRPPTANAASRPAGPGLTGRATTTPLPTSAPRAISNGWAISDGSRANNRLGWPFAAIRTRHSSQVQTLL